MPKRIFISDVHMGAARQPSNKDGCNYRYDWLRQHEANSLSAFLNHLNNNVREDIVELILLGDIFDNWICPHNEKPPAFSEIIDAPNSFDNKKVIESLNSIAEKGKIKITYVRGNHDMGLSRNDIYRISPKIDFCDVYNKDGIWAVHGNEHDSFNRENPENPLHKGYPLGYFISRAVATQIARTSSDDYSYLDFIVAGLRAIGPKTTAEEQFKVFLKYAKLDENNSEFIMPDGITRNGKKVDTLKASEICELFKKTPLSTAVGDLRYYAESLSSKVKEKANIVIFGHTHTGKLIKFGQDETFPDALYVNSGSWCEDQKRVTFVETEIINDLHFVRLKYWDKNEVKFFDHGNIGRFKRAGDTGTDV